MWLLRGSFNSSPHFRLGSPNRASWDGITNLWDSQLAPPHFYFFPIPFVCSPQTSCCSSSPAACTQDKTSSPEPSPGSGFIPTFPFSGQTFLHALERVMVPLLMAMGLGPFMDDRGKEREHNTILEKALKLASIADARSTWSGIVQKHSQHTTLMIQRR